MLEAIAHVSIMPCNMDTLCCHEVPPASRTVAVTVCGLTSVPLWPELLVPTRPPISLVGTPHKLLEMKTRKMFMKTEFLL